MITGERQAARIRSLYLKTILRQDIGFFDAETNTGEVIGRMSGDTVLILDAMGEKVKTKLLKQERLFFFFWTFYHQSNLKTSLKKIEISKFQSISQVGKLIQLVSTFLGGYALAFAKGWLLTLVMLTSIPLIAMAGAAMSIIFTKASSQEQAAYAKASTVVEQTFGSIRTVMLPFPLFVFFPLLFMEKSLKV